MRFELNKIRAISCLGLGIFSLPFSMSVRAEPETKAAILVPGTTVNIDETSNKYQAYILSDGGTLISNGANMRSVIARDSHLMLNNSTVDSAVTGAAVLLLKGSMAEIHNSTVSAAASPAMTVSQSSKATVTDSVFFSPESGVTVELSGELTLINTQVRGVAQGGARPGWGLTVLAASADIMSGSQVVGEANGIFFNRDALVSSVDPVGKVVVDASTVKGENGAAIKIQGSVRNQASGNITVQNGSLLIAGNGYLLEVEKGDAQFAVDNSKLSGDLVADDTSSMDIVLRKNASLTGDIINGNNVAVNSGAQWQMVGDNSVKTMSLDGGQVMFALDGFHTLSLSELSGTGLFGMKVDLDVGVGDLLSVNGQANGDFTLNVKNTGIEPVSPDLQPLQIVHTEGGDAQFNLLGGKVDLGAYSYELEKQGNDWFIVGEDKIISPSTQSALALFNAAPTIFMSEMTTLRSRMGEVRGSGEGGGWMRAYGSRFDASTSSGVDYRQNQRGMSFGADAPIPVSNGQLLVGLLGGYSKSDLDLNRGSSGKVDSYYVGAYSTWLSDQGYYVDAVAKVNQLQNESKVAMSDGTKAKGDYHNMAVGGSLEVGKHIKLSDDYFVEPYAQMAAVVIQGDSYTLDNGLEAKNDRTQSVLGKVGSSVGRNIALKDGGVLQPYLRAAVAHEFARSNKVTVNDTSFNNDLFGSRAELGAGVAVTLSKSLQVHADFDYMKGNHVEQPWGANVGVRWNF